MGCSVYLSNQSVRLVEGEVSGRVLKAARCGVQPLEAPAPAEGADLEALEAPLAAALKSLFDGKTPDRATLVLDAEGVDSRILEAPLLRGRKMRTLVRNEMAPAGQDTDERVYDYTVLRRGLEGGGARVFAVSLEKAAVRWYVELFEKMGVRLTGIDVAPTCAARFFGEAGAFSGQSFLYSLLDGGEMTSMFFGGGEYIFSNRTRLSEARGTPAAAVEMSRALSGMVQFNYGQASPTTLKSAWICGVVGDEAQFFPDIAQALSLEVGPLPKTALVEGDAFAQGGQSYDDYLFCLGDLLG